MAKKFPWLKEKPSAYAVLPEQIILQNIDKFIQTIFPHYDPKTIKFSIWNRFHETTRYHNHIARSTVEGAIKAGHTDSDIFIFVNCINSTYNSATKQSVHSKAYHAENWIFELDIVPGCDSEAEIRALIDIRGLAQPKLVVRTSYQSFHCLYIGGPNYWGVFQNRLAFAKKFAQIPVSVTDEATIRQLMKKAGVDYGHLKTDILNHKIRIPGSINSGKTTSSDKITVCTGCYGSPIQVVQPLIVTKMEMYPPFVQNRIEHLRDHFRELNILEQDCELFGDLMGSQWTALKNGRAKVCQSYWGNQYGIAQTGISRRLKELRRKGYLEIARKHIFHPEMIKKKEFGKSTIYRAGPKLLEIMEILEPAVRRQEFNIDEPYVDGMSYLHFLSDIRTLWERGHEKQYVIDFIMEKQKGREKNRLRTAFSIGWTFDDWDEKQKDRGRKPSRRDEGVSA